MSEDYMRKRLMQKIYGKQPEPKKIYRIPKVSEKRARELAEQKLIGSDSAMNNFFGANRGKMKGVCLFCGADTMKKDNDKFHFSMAHLLPKAIFKSVSTHPDILIELCFYNNSCHTNFDNGIITWEFIKDSKEWEFIKEKLLNVLPMVSMEERKHKLYSKLEKLIYNQ